MADQTADKSKEPEKKLSDIEKQSKESSTDTTSQTAAAPGIATSAQESAPKKRFSLPKVKLPFGKKPAPDLLVESPDASVQATPVIPISPEEVVNQLDQDLDITAQSKEEELAAQMDQQIAQAKTNQTTLSINRQKVLVFLGTLVVISWLIPLSIFIKDASKSFSFPSLKKEDIPEESPQPSPEASASARRIRIKDASEGSEAVKAVATLLEDGGYDYVEIVTDDQVEGKAFSVATKADTQSEFASISAILLDTYDIASDSAFLSDDSDFVALIMFPKELESK